MSEALTLAERIHARRMARLKQQATVRERVVTRMLKKSIEPPERPARPNLKLVK